MSLIRKFADHSRPDSLAASYRRRRFAFFRELLDGLEGPIKILDIGGTIEFWGSTGFTGQPGVEVVVMNVEAGHNYSHGVQQLVGDATRIPFPDRSFAVAFSNSVIEHVGGYDLQVRMASEVRRVAPRYFVQTPNRHFPIEPHFLFPFFQYLPEFCRVWLVHRFRLGWYGRNVSDRRGAQSAVKGIRLLNKSEVRRMFPDARIYEEKVAGLTKSFVAYGGWEDLKD